MFQNRDTFGSQRVFGLTSNARTNPFAPKPVASSTFKSFSTQTGGSLFGGTSTGVFGKNTSTFTTAPKFGASSSPSFGTTSPAFGAPSTPGSSPASGSFGSATVRSNQFGGPSQQTKSAFGSGPYGSTSHIGSSSQTAFGSTTTPAFGSTPAFGISSIPAFGVSSAPTFGGSNTRPSSTTSAPAFGSTTFGTTGNAFGVSSGPVLRPTTTACGPGVSADPESSNFGPKPASIYPSTPGSQFGQKPGVPGGSGFCGGTTSSVFSSPFGSSSLSPFGSSSNLPSLSASAPASAFGTSSMPSTLAAPVSSSFELKSPSGSSAATGSTPSSGPGLAFNNTQSDGLFQSSAATASQSSSQTDQSTAAVCPAIPAINSNPVGTQSAGFGWNSLSPFTPSFGPGLALNNAQSAWLFQSSAATTAKASSQIGQSNASVGLTAPGISSNPFSTQSAGFGGISLNTSIPSLLAPSSAPVGYSGDAPAASTGLTNSVFENSTIGQINSIQTNVAAQPAPVTNPFGTLPAMQQLSIGRAGPSSIRCGIASMPVSETPTPVRVTSVLTPRHISLRRTRLPPRNYNPKSDGQRVPFFCHEEEASSTPKADALFIPRENPRALIICPIEQLPSKTASERRQVAENNVSFPTQQNGKYGENGEYGHYANDVAGPSKFSSRKNVNQGDQVVDNGVNSSYTLLCGNRAGEAAIGYEHVAAIDALMPKLRHPEYFTEPGIKELAAKERAEPGFCRHVKDFVVGRHGYGNIRFEGETDVRGLDLESLVQFNNREVSVYMDESKRPPVGEGLNKPAEVTLSNVKCVDKKTGRQYTEGPKVEAYKELLRRKVIEQGAEFVSYDPIKGEWTFKVKHFSD